MSHLFSPHSRGGAGEGGFAAESGSWGGDGCKPPPASSPALVIPRARVGVNHPPHALLTPALHQHRHAQHSRILARSAATITVDATFKVVARKAKARVNGAPTTPGRAAERGAGDGGCLRGYQVTLYIRLSGVHRARGKRLGRG